MALFGLLALLAHGSDAAVSVYTPRGPTGLRAAQECADLGSWLAYLGAGACADLGVDAAVCADLAKPDRANARCVETHGPAVSKALGDAKHRHEKELWKGTAAFTISAFNNWGVVRPFLTSLLDHNEHLPGLTWFLADSPHDGDAVVDDIRADFKALQARYPATDLRLESLDDVTAAMAYDARELAFRYDLKCFNTAIKPHVFRMLFNRGYRSVLYFDPDIHFYADFDEVALLLRKRTFVLTPHETRESPDDGEWQTDLQIMRAGVYNYGFLGLSNAYPDVLDHYLAWWADTLRYQGGVDLEAGLHFDQNWAVFVPSFYPEKTYKVLVDPRYNAAYWNLHYRGAEITYNSDSDVTYGGAPLVFFHFSGVSTDVINFDAISPHQTRYSLGDLPNLRPLLASYAAAVADSAYYREHSRYGLDAFDNGAPAPFWARDLYGPLSFKGRHAKTGPSSPKPAFADAILALDANPFATDTPNSLWRWLFENRYDVIVDDCSEGGWLPNAALLLLDVFDIEPSRFRTARGARTWFYHYGSLVAAHVLERKDAKRPALREAVRRLVGAGRRRSHRSLEAGFGDDETTFCCEVVLGRACAAADLRRGCGGIIASSNSTAHALWQAGLRAAAVANKDKECAADGPVDDFGVNVVGYVDGVFGVAESSRYLYHGLDANVPTAAVKLRDTPAYAFRDHGIPTTRAPGFGFNVVVQNADMSHDVAASYPWRQWRRRYNVGYWAYELEKLPDRFAAGALIYDEIWATSEFTADAVRSALASDPVTAMIPVKAMPVGVPLDDEPAPRDRAADRGRWGWDAATYVFLVVYDVRSVVERKNPAGAVAAFQKAFSKDDATVRLVLKSHGDSADKAAVDALAAGWPNIQAIDDRLDDDVFASLKGAADCYVSLHRSEGYGLNVLEALLAGTPTIATTYSGNMDFMKHLPQPTLENLGVAWAPKTLDADVGPYPRGGAWSEPSADDAARAMAHAASKRAEVRAAAQADAATLRAKFSAAARGAAQAARLRAVDGLRRSRPAVPDESIYCYWLKNPDLREAFGNDLAAVTAHWNDQGQAEGRELACDWLSAAALEAAKLVLV